MCSKLERLKIDCYSGWLRELADNQQGYADQYKRICRNSTGCLAEKVLFVIPKVFEPLFSSQVVAQRIHDLAHQISEDYTNIRPVIIGVLKGSFVFLSDLVRKLTIDADIDFTQISSYGSSQVSSGCCELKKDISLDIAGRHILIIDDIIDTGLTMAYLKEHFQRKYPESVKICCLIDKQIDRACAVSIDYSAFTIQDGFVVGYGLDFDERFRGLPEIYRLTAS